MQEPDLGHLFVVLPDKFLNKRRKNSGNKTFPCFRPCELEMLHYCM
jgi:hypothetical protein